MVQDGEFPQWSKILNNERYVLRRGYYATRLPGATPKEMNWTWDEARVREKSLFGREPWNQYSKRLGIANLTEALSSGLAELIDSRLTPGIYFTDFCRLPGLREELMSMTHDIQQQLEQLPPSFVDEPQTKLLALCNDFVSELGEHAVGSPRHPAFLSDLHQLFRKLSAEIRRTRPQFEVPKISLTPGVLGLYPGSMAALPSPHNGVGSPVQPKPACPPESKSLCIESLMAQRLVSTP